MEPRRSSRRGVEWGRAVDFQFDYDQMAFLDAENLAEGGIGKAYEALLPRLRRYVNHPARLEEVVDDYAPRYAVRFGGREFVIYAPELEGELGESWGRATYAFFTILNEQLAGSEYRFFAINGGNDLGGLFLTPAQAEASRKTLSRKEDWPYLPTDEYPWYGQYHD
jgi:hypothetical protein